MTTAADSLSPKFNWIFLFIADEYRKRALDLPPSADIDPPSSATAGEWWWARSKAQEALGRLAYRSFLLVYGLPDNAENLRLFGQSFWPIVEIASRNKATSFDWNPPGDAYISQ